MTYLTDLWHDIRAAWDHFWFLRNYLRQGGNPDFSEHA